MNSAYIRQTDSLWGRLISFLVVAWMICASSSFAHAITRAEALKIAESYIQHRWQSSSKNLFHGKDADGIEVHTPDREGGHGVPLGECWRVNAENLGVSYKWGGYDTPESFARGVRAGKAAGDVYTAEKRRADGDAVSASAVGIDCSGFICRSWKLKKRYSTYSLPSICRKLLSPTELEPADIMNQPRGHVLLFVKWLDAEKGRALFYEAAPFSKTLASERNMQEMMAAGYTPLRYRHIRN